MKKKPKPRKLLDLAAEYMLAQKDDTTLGYKRQAEDLMARIEVLEQQRCCETCKHWGYRDYVWMGRKPCRRAGKRGFFPCKGPGVYTERTFGCVLHEVAK